MASGILEPSFSIAALSADCIAARATSEQLFTLLNRRLTVPPAWGALVEAPDQPPRWLRAGETLERAGGSSVSFVRAGSWQTQHRLTGLRSADGFAFEAALTFDAAIVAGVAEATAFARKFLSRLPQCNLDQVRDFFQAEAQRALTELVAAQPAERLLSAEVTAALSTGLAQRLAPESYAVGIEGAPWAELTLSSPDWQQAASEATAAAALTAAPERGAAAAAAAVDPGPRAGRTRADRCNDCSPPARPIRRRGSTAAIAALRGQLRAGGPLAVCWRPVLARQTQFILVVAGDELVWIDPARADAPVRRVDLGGRAGPLRSVRVRHGQSITLLVGAATGVSEVSLDGTLGNTATIQNAQPVRGGFNAAAVANGTLYATHSEFGLVGWRPGADAAPTVALAECTRGARTVRDVQRDAAGRIWLAVDRRIFAWRVDDDAAPIALAAPAEVTTLSVGESLAVAGLADGQIVAWPIDARPGDSPQIVRSAAGSSVGSAELWTACGVDRVLVTDGRPMADLLVVGDAHRTEYAAGEPLRWGWIADDWVVCVNDRRDRLLLWPTASPQPPPRVIPVGRWLNRSIQDVALCSHYQTACATEGCKPA
ncbi:MAG: hypothetical protein U1A27_09300 [Phycisphaerae bacterium]